MTDTAKRLLALPPLGLLFLAGWAWPPLFVVAALLLALWLYRWAWVTIPEWHVGIVYNRERQSFARLLPAGRHFIWPGFEQLRTTLATEGLSASATTRLPAQGGLPLKISWSVSYSLRPFTLSPEKQSQLALKLATKSNQILRKYGVNSLGHIVSALTLAELGQPGGGARLERELRQQLRTSLGGLGFHISRVMIGAIELPEPVLAALESAHNQELKAEQEARSLARLQQVVSQFSNEDMARLMELERIHKLGQNGVALLYPTPSSSDRQAGWLRPTDLLAPLQLN